jgi:hypothetical protein
MVTVDRSWRIRKTDDSAFERTTGFSAKCHRELGQLRSFRVRRGAATPASKLRPRRQQHQAGNGTTPLPRSTYQRCSDTGGEPSTAQGDPGSRRTTSCQACAEAGARCNCSRVKARVTYAVLKVWLRVHGSFDHQKRSFGVEDSSWRLARAR